MTPGLQKAKKSGHGTTAGEYTIRLTFRIRLVVRHTISTFVAISPAVVVIAR